MNESFFSNLKNLKKSLKLIKFLKKQRKTKMAVHFKFWHWNDAGLFDIKVYVTFDNLGK